MNSNHPEAKEGEQFLTNILESQWDSIPHKSKRKGVTAYRKNGTIIPLEKGIRPVFVDKAEYEALRPTHPEYYPRSKIQALTSVSA